MRVFVPSPKTDRRDHVPRNSTISSPAPAGAKAIDSRQADVLRPGKVGTDTPRRDGLLVVLSGGAHVPKSTPSSPRKPGAPSAPKNTSSLKPRRGEGRTEEDRRRRRINAQSRSTPSIVHYLMYCKGIRRSMKYMYVKVRMYASQNGSIAPVASSYCHGARQTEETSQGPSRVFLTPKQPIFFLRYSTLSCFLLPDFLARRRAPRC